MRKKEGKERDFQRQFVPQSVRDIFSKAFRQGLKVSWMLLKIYIPVSIITAVLDRIGFLDLIAPVFEPLMKLIGLPGEAALVLLAAWVNNLFAAIAAASVIDLSIRQITIIAIVTGFAHNLIVETGVLVKLKMARPAIALTRIVFGFAAGMVLNLIMPETVKGIIMNPYAGSSADFSWTAHLSGIAVTTLQIVIVMFLVMLVYEFFLYWKHSGKIKEKLTVFTRFFGMSSAALGPWLVGTFIGIAYGAGILFDMNRKHLLTHKDNCLLTASLCLFHAVVEDTVIFVVIGANLWWILGARILSLILIITLLSRNNLYKKFTWAGLPKATLKR
ncbi:MAG: hypothetical protein U5N26_05745 [Candidatus Marinimicrobia bacterium]|nr:hypothetical protein [Candidatus Neomarinimicrobiota bacterium]